MKSLFSDVFVYNELGGRYIYIVLYEDLVIELK